MRGAVCVHAELPLTSAINMQKKIHWLPNISQAARVFVSHTISSLYQTTLTSKETRLCLSEEENLWMPSWRRSYLCNMTLQLVPISPAQRVFSTGYPCSKLCITFKITGFVKEKNNCFCSLRMSKGLNKNRLTLLNLCVLLSCVVSMPIYGHLMGVIGTGVLPL